MRLVARWGVVVAGAAAGSVLAWWVCLELIKLDEAASLGIAGAVTATILAVGASWAPRRADSNRPEASAGRRLWSELELATIPRSHTVYRRSLQKSPANSNLRNTSVWLALIIVLLAVLFLASRGGFATHRDTVSLLIRGSWAVVGFTAAVGVVSAGIIQVGKQVFGVRGIVQRTWVLRWIETRSTEEPLWSDWRERHPEISRDDTVADLADAQRQLASIELQRALLGGLSPHELQRVFNLPVEQLCAQIGAAADLAMSEPQDHAELLLALTGPAWLKEIDSLAPPNRVVNGRIFRRRSEDNTAYALVAQAARSGVDMMQISLGQRWQRGVRLAAIYVSGLLGVTAAVLVHGSVLAQVLLGAAALVLGGFFSWLTRDLVAIVERVRR